MCDIVGYVGQRDALPMLMSSLERVTHRGYDSFGVALLNGKGIELFKAVGPVDEHRDQVSLGAAWASGTLVGPLWEVSLNAMHTPTPTAPATSP